MAARYWVQDGGNWSDAANHWSASTGGAPNASLPTSSDNVYFDANSFTIPGQTVTVDATAFCLDMDWTGATNNPTLAFGSKLIEAHGDIEFINAQSITVSTGTLYLVGTAKTLTTNGCTISPQLYIGGGAFSATITLQDTLNCNKLALYLGTLDTNDQTINCDSFAILLATNKTLTSGASVINCTSWNYSGSNLTLTANTATINVSGTGAFAGGNIATYHDVALNGSAHTISGSNTFSTLTLLSTATQTITFTDGTTQTATTFTLSGSSGHVHTLQGSGTAGWNMAKAGGGNVIADYLSISYSTVT